MDKNRIFKIFDEVYSLTDNVTPKKFDCGGLCGSACCKSASYFDNESGMHLLPFEKEYLVYRFSNLPFNFIQTENEQLLVCKGSCDRNSRPLSCRIFPYYVNILENQEIKISHDIRALHLCPLLISKKYRRKNVYFSRNVKRAYRLLLNEPILKEDIIKTSEFVNSIFDLNSRIFGLKWGDFIEEKF